MPPTPSNEIYINSTTRGVEARVFAPGECSRLSLALGDLIAGDAPHLQKLFQVMEVTARGVWVVAHDLVGQDPYNASPAGIRRNGTFLTFKGLLAMKVTRVRVENGINQERTNKAFITEDGELVLMRDKQWRNLEGKVVHLPIGAILHPLAGRVGG